MVVLLLVYLGGVLTIAGPWILPTLQQRLYQLVRQPGEVGEHASSIEFLDPGARAYSFTLG